MAIDGSWLANQLPVLMGLVFPEAGSKAQAFGYRNA
jgi:hypothetical protein